MRTTICKKCGAKIDATLGICPFCGTTFTVSPEDAANREKDKELEWAMSMDDEPLPGGFVQGTPRQSPPYGAPQGGQGPASGFGPDGVYRGADRPEAGAYGRTAPGTGTQPDAAPPYGQGANGAYGRTPNGAAGQSAGAGRNSFGPDDLENADNDELFNTRVWKNDNAQNQPRTAAPPVSRQEIHRAPREQEQEYRRPQRTAMSSAEARAKAEQERRKEEELHKKKTFVTVLAIVAALTLLLCIIGGVFNFGKNAGSQTMPDVVGYTADTAKNVLENDPYKLKVETKTVDSDKTENTVVEQSIEKDKKITAGETVTLSISNGKGTSAAETSDSTDYVDVPDLSGKTYEQAKSTLDALGLEIARNDDVYSDQDAGDIVAQTPMKGAKLQKGDLVTVTISKGQMASPSPSAASHKITVTASAGGSVSPKGSVSVNDGDDKTFTFTPLSGYEIKEVKVDGKNIGAVDSYTFPLVARDHTLYVVFEKTAETPAPSTPVEPSSAADATA